MTLEPLFLGIDLGTSGVRALVATSVGHLVAQASTPLTPLSRPVSGIHEQDPEAWWTAVRRTLQALWSPLEVAGLSLAQIRAVSVDGTSGTLVAVDSRGQPVRPAVMYNDGRAGEEAAQLQQLAAEGHQDTAFPFEASHALAKIVWMSRHEPANFQRAQRFLHQADFIVGRLTGDFGVTDYCNALKTGYDVQGECWPRWIAHLPGVAERLPRVVPPATIVGQVSTTGAKSTGLPPQLPVIAGATDGVAAAVASGLHRVGDYNTTLGTTLVFKGLTGSLVRDPDGVVYSHKLPGGLWLPGGASNTGAAWIGAWFGGSTPQDLDRQVVGLLPSPLAAYPLAGRGERFPFRAVLAESFIVPQTQDQRARYAACLTGTALVERLGYETLDAVLGVSSGEVYSTGSASASDIWMQCRADVTRRTLHRPAVAESAFGSAILAAAGTVFGSIREATGVMAKVERTFTPQPDAAAVGDAVYGRFREELGRRGYLR